MTLDELYSAVMRGDAGALNKLLLHLSSDLNEHFVKRVGVERAQDLTQNTLIVIAKKLPKFKGRGQDLRRWAFAIARFEGYEAARQQRRYDTLRRALARVEPATVTNLSSRLHFIERLELLESAVAKLSDKDRRAIENELAGGDASTLAKQEGIALSSARARKTRAHQKLRGVVQARSKQPQPVRRPTPPSSSASPSPPPS